MAVEPWSCWKAVSFGFPFPPEWIFFFSLSLLTLLSRSVTPTGIYEQLKKDGYDLGTRRERLASAPGFPAEITQDLEGVSIRK